LGPAAKAPGSQAHISCEYNPVPASITNFNKAHTNLGRTSTSFQLVYGRLSDIFSRKTVLLSCIFIFFIGSLAASLAQTATQIIAFRALTGVGGGGLMTLAQTIVSDVVTLRERLVVRIPSNSGNFLANGCALEEGNIRAYWYDSSSPVELSTPC
jgi:hypothetical protein